MFIRFQYGSRMFIRFLCLTLNFLVFHNSFYSNNNLKLNPLGLNLTLILDLIVTVIPVYVFNFQGLAYLLILLLENLRACIR